MDFKNKLLSTAMHFSEIYFQEFKKPTHFCTLRPRLETGNNTPYTYQPSLCVKNLYEKLMHIALFGTHNIIHSKNCSHNFKKFPFSKMTTFEGRQVMQTNFRGPTNQLFQPSFERCRSRGISRDTNSETEMEAQTIQT